MAKSAVEEEGRLGVRGSEGGSTLAVWGSLEGNWKESGSLLADRLSLVDGDAGAAKGGARTRPGKRERKRAKRGR